MKKLLLTSLAAAALSLASLSATAATTVVGGFTVSVSLLGKCTVNGSPTVDFGNYTAFGSEVSAAAVDIKLTCTRNMLAPTALISGTIGGVVAGLNYQLTTLTPAGTIDGTPGANPSAAAGQIGTPDVWKFPLGGTMAGGQAGNCAGATTTCAGPVTDPRVITFTY